MHRRCQPVPRAVREHSGGELRDAAEHRAERREVERRVRRSVPAGEVRGDDERRGREPEQAENRRWRDRSQEDSRAVLPGCGAVRGMRMTLARCCLHYSLLRFAYGRLLPEAVGRKPRW